MLAKAIPLTQAQLDDRLALDFITINEIGCDVWKVDLPKKSEWGDEDL